MLAVGRSPNVEGLGLETVGVELDKKGAIQVDEYSRTNVDHIWAIGDVTDRLQLTPVAIHEAMCFVETVFRGRPTKPDHTNVATAVFSQPEIGTVGMTEDDARASATATSTSTRPAFRPLKGTLTGRSDRMLMKLVVDADTDRVLGAHVLGPGAGEMAQLLGIPVKMRRHQGRFRRHHGRPPDRRRGARHLRAPTERIRNGETLAA